MVTFLCDTGEHCETVLLHLEVLRKYLLANHMYNFRLI